MNQQKSLQSCITLVYKTQLNFHRKRMAQKEMCWSIGAFLLKMKNQKHFTDLTVIASKKKIVYK